MSEEQVARIGLLAGGGVRPSAPLGGRNNFGGGPDNARFRDLTAELPARAPSPHAGCCCQCQLLRGRDLRCG